ncbi:tetratricopeptide repeat protein [Catenulispora pinisilvae]|uniref:tetratricopeptide repeat protein n=1 Tax=Catenulispora pinisilvae TaxID=2705253 RepID=UPI001892806D|nr:tetratricopeptide repeat protein [Catenulispora pinisilvae]
MGGDRVSHGGDVRSELSGSAANAVLARDIDGGVHFHAAASALLVPWQLPRAVSHFRNREAELAELDAAADVPTGPGSCPVAVVRGPAGVGKTALALRWGHRSAARFPDGQLYVNLRGYDRLDPLAVSAALESLLLGGGVDPSAVPAGAEARAALYRSVMSGRRRMVMLDNAASSDQITDLLPTASGSFVLVTSRDRLSELGASEEVREVAVDVLSETEAVALLRGVAGRSGAADADLLAELAELCAHLPLALRIAGEKLAAGPSTPLGEFVEGLREESTRIDKLSGTSGRTAVRTVFGWSYRSLSDDGARLFRALGLHPGSDFSAPSAAALTQAPEDRVRVWLDELARAHLVWRKDDGRFEFHDLLRVFAADLARAEEGPQVAARAVTDLAAWYLRGALSAGRAMGVDSLRLPEPPDALHAAAPSFTSYDEALRWYLAERANLAAAVGAASDAGRYDLAWLLAGALLGIYEVTNEFDDWISTSHAGLGAARRCGDRFGEAVMLESLGKACRAGHQLDFAEQYQREALQIREAIGDRHGRIRSVNALGLVHRRAGRPDEARDCFQLAHTLAEEAGDVCFQALALLNLGGLDVETRRYVAAHAELEQALPLLRATGQHVYTVNALQDLAGALAGLGRLAEALSSATAAVQTATGLGNRLFLARALMELARVRRALGDPEQALTDYEQAIALHRELGDRNREAITLDEAGTAHAEAGRFDRAVELHAAAAGLHHELGDTAREEQALSHLAAARRRQGADPSTDHV